MASTPPPSLFILPHDDDVSKPSFVEKNIGEKYNCIKCKALLRTPVKQLFCGHRMCEKCVQEIKQSGDLICPGSEEDCKETDLANPSHIFPDYGIEREMKNTKVYCSNKNFGCTEVMPWMKLRSHLNECTFKPLDCKYKEFGCLEKHPKEKFQRHIEQCKYRAVLCEHCNKRVPQVEMDEGHEAACVKRPKECEFKSLGCRYAGLKEDLEKHLHQDHLPHIQILFTNYKNMQQREEELLATVNQLRAEKAEMERSLDKALKQNNEIKERYDKRIQNLMKMTGTNSEKLIELEPLKETATHVRQLQNVTQIYEGRISQLERNQSSGTSCLSDDLRAKILSSERQMGMNDVRLAEYDLRFQCLETGSYNGTLIWKIRDYQRRKQEAVRGSTLSLYSQPFYTSKFGYKMCARVYLNGDGMGKGSHISLFFVIMKGDYDALLPWPFRQKVTLTLMDQDTGRRHLADTFRPDPTSTSFKKPTAEMNVASGCPLFAAQTVAESKTYLKDDTIFIKVAVDTTDLNIP